ncbi:thermonuclease family protein [Kaistella antarctica]|uniref:Nuclease n=1 Tax=Kaistella antarctica TaxID=266748 RepID=A0A3S4V3D6_9FLAO|nr:thermonuclease family protein [Kaistella antarctica]KEY17967.1 nuclease [Kaistella antarctica]SEV81712.1 Endonuclease YncB, thermonuclease family [Kaistella antarctica]VEI00404.1 Thermonuclease precursor [Kaistella antarctica]
MRKITMTFFLLISILFLSQIEGKIVGVKDGDTVVILLEGNIQKTLRLAEVDCPENGQPFGKNAKKFTSEMVFGKMVTFVETDTDRYGRSIAKIYYDNNKYLSEELIRAGYGWWYYHYSKDKSLENLEHNAKQNRLGLWQDENAIAPWDYRRAQRNK